MRVGSLFSGIGGFDLGLERAGMEIAWQVEIDPFCQRVLAKHWPEVPRYGDVRMVRGGWFQQVDSGARTNAEGWRRASEQPSAPDLICGGFPCQDLSVAGKRAGLAGDRSGLWFEFHRILSELRPTFCLIENVPGLLSSNEGRDFGIVLSGLGELWPAVGWAVLDSQHFGVPQRRRRVYIVGGPTRESVQQILSLCEGGDWHPQKGREAGEDVAFGAPSGLAHSLSNVGGGNDYGANKGTLVANPLLSQGGRRQVEETYVPELVGALSDGAHMGGGLNGQDVYTGRVIAVSADGFDASEDGTERGTPLAVAFMENQRGETWMADIPQALNSGGGKPGQGYAAAMVGASVRRLTPVECERLQGFPDGWTQLDDRTPDGPRYRALGNAVTVPVIEYIGRRIAEVLA